MTVSCQVVYIGVVSSLALVLGAFTQLIVVLFVLIVIGFTGFPVCTFFLVRETSDLFVCPGLTVSW